MMKKIFLLAFVVGFFVSCSKDNAEPAPLTERRYLYLSGYAGDDNADTRASWTDSNTGKLAFAWDYSAPDVTTSELKMAFVKEGNCLETAEGNRMTDARILKHTDEEKAEDSHWAEFETIEGFDSQISDSEYDGHTVYAVTPVNDVNSSTVNVEDNGIFTATLKMPTTFIQAEKNDLAHLSNYAYMYAEDVLANCTASLSFKHLAAYLRFKVYNWRSEPAILYGVEMEVVDADGNAVPASSIRADYSANGFTYTSAAAGAGIRVNFAKGGQLFDDKVFLYAPVFPVGSENPFQGKSMRFTLIAEDPSGVAAPGEYKYFTYELDGETFKNVSGSYDWIPGDLYTFHLYLDDGPTE